MTHAVRTSVGAARTVPFVIATVFGLWAIGFLSHSLLHGPPESLLERANFSIPTVHFQSTWYPIASHLWCADLAGYLATTALLVAVCAPIERRIGSARTMILFALTLCGATVFAFLLIAGRDAVDISWLRNLRSASAAGPSVGVFGVALAFTYRLAAPWDRRVRLNLIVLLIALAFYSAQLQDLLRLAGGLTGLALGFLLFANHRAKQVRPTSTPKEARLLVALVMAACALGPLVTYINHVSDGPGVFLQRLWVSPRPTAVALQRFCTGTPIHKCQMISVHVALSGLAPFTRMALPVLLVLVLAEGMRRGRRSAWIATLTFNSFLACLGALVVMHETRRFTAAPTAVRTLGAFGWVQLAASLVVPLSVMILVAATREHFSIRSTEGSYRHLFFIGLSALVCTSTIFVVGGHLARRQFDHVASWHQLLADLPLRFLPPTYLGLVAPPIFPQGATARALCTWTGITFWAVLLTGTAASFWKCKPALSRPNTEAMRDLLRRHGGSTISFMATWRGNSHWFSPDGQAAIAYRVIASVALTMGDPVGAPDSLPEAVRGFVLFCAYNGWVPCFYSITDELASTFSEMGWQMLHVAQDTVVPLESLDFSGRKWQDVRTALSRAKRSGITATWLSYADAPSDIIGQIELLSLQSRAERGTPEMGFTLGTTRELADPDIRCVIALDVGGKLHAVISWLPIFRRGQTIGWTLDILRRDKDAMPGVIEFLIASSAVRFRSEGAAIISLSSVPLSRLDRGEPRKAMHLLLDVISTSLNPIYGFRSLLAFKSKFQPTYHPIYLGYQDPASLPMIFLAIGRAYLPSLSSGEIVRLVGRMLRQSTQRRRINHGRSLRPIGPAGGLAR